MKKYPQSLGRQINLHEVRPRMGALQAQPRQHAKIIAQSVVRIAEVPLYNSHPPPVLPQLHLHRHISCLVHDTHAIAIHSFNIHASQSSLLESIFHHIELFIQPAPAILDHSYDRLKDAALLPSRK